MTGSTVAFGGRATPITDAIYGKKQPRRGKKPPAQRRNDHHSFSVGENLSPETFTALEQLKAELRTPAKKRRRPRRARKETS